LPENRARERYCETGTPTLFLSEVLSSAGLAVGLRRPEVSGLLLPALLPLIERGAIAGKNL
jgi:hypothetical protein